MAIESEIAGLDPGWCQFCALDQGLPDFFRCQANAIDLFDPGFRCAIDFEPDLAIQLAYPGDSLLYLGAVHEAAVGD